PSRIAGIWQIAFGRWRQIALPAHTCARRADHRQARETWRITTRKQLPTDLSLASKQIGFYWSIRALAAAARRKRSQREFAYRSSEAPEAKATSGSISSRNQPPSRLSTRRHSNHIPSPTLLRRPVVESGLLVKGL